jgi:hypothetical protein
MHLQEIKFEDKNVISLNLETLKASAEYRRGSKFPQSHYVLIEDVLSRLNAKGLAPTIETIYVSKNGCQYPTENYVQRSSDLKSIYDTQGVIINNLVTKITLGGSLANEDNAQAIAISYNKLGIQISMGLNVWVCQNMNIFGSTVISNYGGTGIAFDKMIDVLNGWIANIKAYHQRDQRVLEAMRGIRFMDAFAEMQSIIGHLYWLAEIAPKTKDIVAPLNHSRITDLLREFIALDSVNPTLYDLYQCATNVSTHQDVIENRIKDTHLIGEYFAGRYGIDISVGLDEENFSAKQIEDIVQDAVEINPGEISVLTQDTDLGLKEYPATPAESFAEPILDDEITIE